MGTRRLAQIFKDDYDVVAVATKEQRSGLGGGLKADEEDVTPIVKYVKAVSVNQIEEYIPWALEAEGWNSAVKYYRENFLK